jgi:hypothetical protein
MRLFKNILLTSIIFFALVITLMLTDRLTFGHGLGDIIVLYLQTLWLFILVIVYIVILVEKKTKINKIISVVLSAILVLSIFLTIKDFTTDRGSDYPWNGHIFIIKH